MTQWQRRARFALASFAVALTAVVGYTMRSREVRVPAEPVIRLDPKATVETRGGDVIQLKGARQDLRIEFEGQVTYDDGQTKLLGVRIMIGNRSGRDYVITGKEARVGAKQSTYDISGRVKLETSDGLTATCDHATYADQEGIVRAPGPVRFSRGRMSGTSTGFSYDEQTNTVSLLDQVVVQFAPERDAGAMDVTSGAATYARTDRYMRFERSVHLVRQGQVIDAIAATVHLLADQDEPDLIELRGDARVTGGTGLGSLRALSARDINLDYGDDGRTLQRATLAGQAAMQLAAQDGSLGQRLSAEWMDVTLAADGAPTGLSSRDGVQVTLPEGAGTPSRAIRSTSLTATGAAGQGLTAMKFHEGVEYREAATRDHGERLARAATLDSDMTPGTGALREARFAGGFRFEDGNMRATSGDARYEIAAGRLALTGKDGVASPRVADDRLTIDADAIDITLVPRKMVAAGNVRTVLQPVQKAAAGAPPAKRPGLLGDRDPVNVMADTLTYEEATRLGAYKGQARLWQGDTSIQSESIMLDESQGNLSAKGHVRTSLAIVSKNAPTDAAITPTIATSGGFRYVDQARRAIYDSDVEMNGEQGRLSADDVVLVLAPVENSLDRLEASGKVSVRLEKRVASGTKLAYHPGEEKYVMTGAPVSLVEECRESTGKTLTFFKGSERVTIDGLESNRTQTKGGKCPAPPF